MPINSPLTSQVGRFDIRHRLRLNIEEQLLAEIQRNYHRRRRRTQAANDGGEHGHVAPEPEQGVLQSRIPLLGDLFPNLLSPTVGPIVLNAHEQYIRSLLLQQQQRDNENSAVETTNLAITAATPTENADVVEETWSQFLLNLGEYRPRRSMVFHHHFNPRLARPTFAYLVAPTREASSTVLSVDEVDLLETQLIPSQLDAFITSLQQDRKDFYKYDDTDQLQTKERHRATRIKISLTLIFLFFIVFGNLAGSMLHFYMLIKHLRDNDENMFN